MNKLIIRILAFLIVTLSAEATAIYSWTNFVGQPGGRGNGDGPGSLARFGFPRSVAADSAGNVYVADMGNQTIRKMTVNGEVTTLAGLANISGSSDGTGSEARFYMPSGVAVDGAGNVYVADNSNHTIRKVTPNGEVSTLAGLAGSSGSADGTGSAARFTWPAGVAVDSAGNVYVADYGNSTIRKVTAGGVVSTLAGRVGTPGSADGTGSAARFWLPQGLAVNSDGEVYVADYSNHTIRKVTAGGVVTTLAGLAGSYGSANGTGSAARFHCPQGVAVDAAGNVYVADNENHTIRKVTAGGEVTTLAGLAETPGSADGAGSVARFSQPAGVAVDSAGNLYVADYLNNTIRGVTPDGVVTTPAGLAVSSGSADGAGSAARFYNPLGLAVDRGGNLYVADDDNHTIRKVTAGGEVTTLAGEPGSAGSADGAGSAARFNLPYGVAVDSAGNLYVADHGNNTIRKVTAAGAVTTLAGLAGSSGNADGAGSAARFNGPDGVAVDSAGNLYVSDYYNDTIRKVTAEGVVTTLAGWSARFYYPSGLAVDSAGNVYVADNGNHTIRKITAGGVATTLAGLAGSYGSADGTGSAARFHTPRGIAVDSTGNLYVADTGNYTVRKVTPSGVVTTIGGMAGVATAVDGPGCVARFSYPRGIAVDSAGSLYVADARNNRISKGTTPGLPKLLITLAGSSVTVSWPDTGSYVLEQTSDLADSGGWLTSSYPVSTANGTHSITITTPAGRLFFQLKQ